MKEFVKAKGIWYANELPTIKKKRNVALQPVYEAFTNAWEAIIEKFSIGGLNNGKIEVKFFVNKMILSSKGDGYSFDHISICDNGIGLDETNYERLVDLRNNSKNFSNKGTGRVQFLHFFDETTIESVYKTSTESRKRLVTLSKNNVFLKQNAILRLDDDIVVPFSDSNTTVIFRMPMDKNEGNFYSEISPEQVRTEIIRHYLSRFCDSRDNFPQISIQRYINDKLDEELQILSSDIPEADKEESITVNYSKIRDDNRVIHTENTEKFLLRSFVQPQESLDNNVLYLVSKGETIPGFSLNNLSEKEVINNNRYMFLLSGDYIDKNDGDDRGNIGLVNTRQFSKQNEDSLFPEEVVLFEDIQDETNKTIDKLYKEIGEASEEKQKNIEELKQMFLLNPDTVEAIRTKVRNTDSDEDILKKIYKSDADATARCDASIKLQMKEIESLIPTKDSYQEELKAKVNEFVQKIPLQNRTALSQYVARRKMVIEVFDKILNKELENLRNGDRIDEELMHNLIFQQSCENSSPEFSDLWLINEEYIYYKGFSEYKLIDMRYNGVKLFDKEFSDEDKKYLNSLDEKRLTKRPDILLFPEEGKCIIIEFKAPDVNVSEHLTQIEFYASLLRNYTIDELQITSFYGYLIGESIEDRDVRGRVSRYEHASQFDYWFRPSEKVTGFEGRQDGNIYCEILKYSSLLERAKLRNKIFIDKLEHGKIQ